MSTESVEEVDSAERGEFSEALSALLEIRDGVG
jgi:hypothetical protein